MGQTWLGTFSWLPSSPPPLNCRNISQRRYRRLEQTGCEEVLALGAWQEHEPGHPGVWGLTAPSHSLEPTDTSNMSFLSSCLRRKCSWITLTRGEERREGAAGNTWISSVFFFLKLQKASPFLISCGLPQKQGKKRKSLSFPSPGEEMGAQRG